MPLVMKFRIVLVVLASAFCFGLSINQLRPSVAESNWLQFSTQPVQLPGLVSFKPLLTRDSVKRLGTGWRITLPEIADTAPLYVSAVATPDGEHDMVLVETMNGRVVAVDARNGETLWQTTPPSGPRWTTSSPAVDRERRFVFAYCLDGAIHKYDLTTGDEIRGTGFPAVATTKGEVEKGSSNIILATAANGETYLYMAMAAYPEPGDDGDYQGHLVTVNINTGERRLFNALCSDRTEMFDDSNGEGDCWASQAGMWARPAAVYDRLTDRIFVTTGNGAYDADAGGYNWGTSVVALHADGSADNGTPLDSYTPANHQQLTDDDLDLSSTALTLLPVTPRVPHLGVQSGKDGMIRLLNVDDLSGHRGPRHVGGELQILQLPQGGEVMTQPVAWRNPTTHVIWVFIANRSGVCGLRLIQSPAPHLVPVWSSISVQGTSPLLANGILFVAASNAFTALDPETGGVLWKDTSIGNIHWQSPIAVNRGIYLCDHEAALHFFHLQ
jgi:outer membrane protein assembly factor BamB